LGEYPSYFDIIFDVWGAFSYSLEKVDILRKYYQSLSMFGDAYIVDGPASQIYKAPSSTLQFSNQNEPKGLFESLCDLFPNHFEKVHDYCYKMSRTTIRFPLENKCTYSYNKMIKVDPQSSHDENTLINACAMIHDGVSINANTSMNKKRKLRLV